MLLMHGLHTATLVCAALRVIPFPPCLQAKGVADEAKGGAKEAALQGPTQKLVGKIQQVFPVSPVLSDDRSTVWPGAA